MFKIFRVSGLSMAPGLTPGDYAVVCNLPVLRRSIRPGDLVVFDHPQYGTMVKRVESVSVRGTACVSVRGTRYDSVDSRRFGAIPLTDIRGKVVWIFRNKRDKVTGGTG